MSDSDKRRLAGICSLASAISDTFRLQYQECPLRKELAAFRLYHHNDMANALAYAYQLFKRGRNPADALNADYGIKRRGILSWANLDHIREEAKPDNPYATRWTFSRFYEPGDRMVEYSWPESRGLLLVRGDRLVWEVETLHLCLVGPSPHWEAAHNHFLALGGDRAFFAREFVWPPDGWVNPVDAEVESPSAAG